MTRPHLVTLAVLSFALSACATGNPIPTGQSPPVIYSPIGDTLACVGRAASLTDIAPGIAVTNEHADDVADGLYGEAIHYDIALVHTKKNLSPQLAEPYVGEHVVQYGNDTCGHPRMATGEVISIVDTGHCYGPVGRVVTASERLCAGYGMGLARGFFIKSDAGDGFSGGPVMDGDRLVGITEGVMTNGAWRGSVIAYRSSDVLHIAQDPDAWKPVTPYSHWRRYAVLAALILF